MKTIGESQGQTFFSKYLQNKIILKYGIKAKFLEGDLAGKQDKRFADFFAGLNSKNILVEFKEFSIIKESLKPLRKKLCFDIPDVKKDISYACHFIAKRIKSNDIGLLFDIYLPAVCPLFGFYDHDSDDSSQTHEAFSSGFIAGNLGSDILDFKTYIEYLSHLSSSSGSKAEDVEFSGALYSFDSSGDLTATIFYNLAELLSISTTIDIDPPRQSIDRGPKIDPPSPFRSYPPQEPRQDRGGPSMGR